MRCHYALFSIMVVFVGAVASSSPAVHADRPNLLFLFADDQAYDTIHAHGCAEIETPNLDRLVARGVTFSRAYNMGGYNGAICVASRAMLVTGRFLWHAERDAKHLNERYVPGGKLWPQRLASAGYETYFSGKWHIQAAADEVFHHARHIRGGMPNQTPEGYHRPPLEGDDVWRPWDTSRGGFWKGGKHWSEVLGDDAVEFLQQAGQRDQPFFMYLAFNAPHDPRQSPREYVERYPLDRLSTPLPFYSEYPHDIGVRSIRDEVLAPYPRSEHVVAVHRQEYYAIITHMDDQIGRILDALEASGKADNTVIVFTADHGLACGHHGLLGKQNMHEHSVRVPFVITGPQFAAGQTIHTPIYLQDVHPTFLELAGLEVSEEVQFKSLLPLLKGRQTPHYKAIYAAYTDKQRMICAANDKLIIYPQTGVRMLFDLENDPLETNNLADDPAQGERIARLTDQLRDLQDEAGDELELKE